MKIYFYFSVVNDTPERNYKKDFRVRPVSLYRPKVLRQGSRDQVSLVTIRTTISTKFSNFSLY